MASPKPPRATKPPSRLIENNQATNGHPQFTFYLFPEKRFPEGGALYSQDTLPVRDRVVDHPVSYNLKLDFLEICDIQAVQTATTSGHTTNITW